jgi:ABC-type branched-subunit amino acid transport system ATPase component
MHEALMAKAEHKQESKLLSKGEQQNDAMKRMMSGLPILLLLALLL